MEGETQVSSEVPVVTDDIDVAGPIKVANGDLMKVEKEGGKEEDETDGEFIKVEKESFDAKSSGEADKPSVVERSLSGPTREMLEAQEKLKELELELERVSAALKHSESENTRMKDDVLLANEKLDEGGKKYGELEISHKKLQEQIMEAEEKFSAQLNTLQEALQAKETKHQELVEVKESFDGITLELENSRKKMQELENELEISSGEAKKFEELHKESGSHAESETQRALEFERLLEAAKLSAKRNGKSDGFSPGGSQGPVREGCRESES
ncbi:EARLY ENDOSOME ANTIGEN [Salix purpurea]|uniref:EARLY ENDOSOME ANTIGEN n=1 Tax=Salix purpurea TaxID=77065 RepID=A0A9Q0Q5R2_SALPP|nr:EARLY ENDOSOME ANTIGEN [Salix purpurea]